MRETNFIFSMLHFPIQIMNKITKKRYMHDCRVSDLLQVGKNEGAPGFEPGTSRSAVECSTTELYPR